MATGGGAMHKAEVAIKWERPDGGALDMRGRAVVNKLDRPIRVALGESFASADGLAMVDVTLGIDGRELRVLDATCGTSSVAAEVRAFLETLEPIEAAGFKVT
jgi:hypothetical protein